MALAFALTPGAELLIQLTQCAWEAYVHWRRMHGRRPRARVERHEVDLSHGGARAGLNLSHDTSSAGLNLSHGGASAGLNLSHGGASAGLNLSHGGASAGLMLSVARLRRAYATSYSSGAGSTVANKSPACIARPARYWRFVGVRAAEASGVEEPRAKAATTPM